MEIIFFKYFWVIGILATIANVIYFKQKSKKYIQEKPELAEGYEKLFRGQLFWLNLLWVVMGIGITIGGVPTIWHYFRPQDGNPYVSAWYGVVFFEWVVGTIWLFFKGGAEMLAKHPVAIALRSKPDFTSSPTGIKLMWLLCVAGGIVGFVMMLKMNIPIPVFR